MGNAATGARTRLLYVEEETEGTTPSTPTMKRIPWNSGSSGISVAFATMESARLRSDRQSEIPRRGAKTISVNVPFESSYQDFNAFLESLLGSTFSSGVLSNGSARGKAFTFEEGFEDLATPQYRPARGVRSSKMKLSLTTSGIVSGSFDFIGLSSGDFSATSLASSVADDSGNEVFDPFTGSFVEGGTSFADAQSLELDIDATASSKHALFSRNPSFNAVGRIKISGTLVVYFKDVSLATKFLDGEASSLSFTLIDPDGNSTAFSLPYITYTGSSISIPEDDIPISLPFTAGVDPTTGKMITITDTDAA